MNEIGRKRNTLKNICTLVIVFVLICCSLSALTQTTIGASPKINPKSQTVLLGDVLLLEENFTDGNMPPTGTSGDWELQQTNPDQTWFIDSTDALSKPYCGTIRRGDSEDLQDEWLITPSLDFGEYTDNINLSFHWYTCFYVTLYKRYIEFNISVSTDGGTTWTNIWCFNNMSLGIPPIPFADWTWYESEYPYYIPIDLSDFGGETDVKIAFQFHSNRTDSAEEQEFSIDEISIIAKGIGGLEADAGGPYSWYWPIQYEYWPTSGVRFHGNVKNWTVPPTTFWDFGDGDTSIFPYNVNPIHFYDDIGTYIVSLTATDYSVTPPKVSVDYSRVTLFLIPPPALSIEVEPISLGIKANIFNDGEYNATYVSWTMNVSWGPLQIFRIFNKTVGNGTIENIVAGSTETIRSNLYFFGFGIMNIEIVVRPENLPVSIDHFKALKIGPLLIFPKV
jgi:PKD domain